MPRSEVNVSSEAQAKVDRLQHHMQTGDWHAALALADDLGFDAIKRTMQRRIDDGLVLDPLPSQPTD